MRIIFTQSVLADSSSWRFLDRILQSVEDEWHIWEVPDPEIIEQSEWMQRAGRNQGPLRELLELSTRRGAWQGHAGPHSVILFVDIASHPPCVLDARSAALCVREPLVVLMENMESDGLFLDAVLDALGSPALLALRRLQPAPIRYDSPGGSGELSKRLAHALDDPAWQGIPRRFVVLTDSDACEPGAWSKTAKAIADECRKRGVACHVLEKRAIENYLPQEVLDDWASAPTQRTNVAWVKVLAQLSPEQRDHFPMKKGLLANDSQDSVAQTLYGSLTQSDRQALARGISKGTLPSLFKTHRATMTPAALRARAGVRPDGSTELDDLVAIICAAL
jgi:hypothetical protein